MYKTTEAIYWVSAASARNIFAILWPLAADVSRCSESESWSMWTWVSLVQSFISWPVAFAYGSLSPCIANGSSWKGHPVLPQMFSTWTDQKDNQLCLWETSGDMDTGTKVTYHESNCAHCKLRLGSTGASPLVVGFTSTKHEFLTFLFPRKLKVPYEMLLLRDWESFSKKGRCILH